MARKKDIEQKPFWETKTLEEMTRKEWEALCDGCGRCCLLKVEDEDSGAIHLTSLSCKLLDIKTCRCSDYKNRKKKVADCLSIDLKRVRSLTWLPESCGYRRIDEGRGLAWWHPLVSGSAKTVHQAGISVKKLARSEDGADPDELYRYIIEDYEIIER